MDRLSKGDRFIDPADGAVLQVLGWPIRKGVGRVQIPVQIDGATRPSRRIFNADKRIQLV